MADGPLPSRERRHLVDVEQAVRRMRWLGLAALPVLVVAFHAPEGVELPVSKAWFIAVYAAALTGLNLASGRVLKLGTTRALRRFGLISTVATTVLVVGVLLVFGVDPTSRFWPLLVVPILEGASRYGLGGALWVWGFSSLAYTSEQLWRMTQRGGEAGSWVSAILWGVAILLIVAGGAGTLSARSERERRRAMRQSERLRELADAARTLSGATHAEEVFDGVLDAATTLTGIRSTRFFERTGPDGWELRAERGGDLPDVGGTAAALARVAELDRPHVEPLGTIEGHESVAVAIHRDDRLVAALVLSAPTIDIEQLAEQDEALRLLAAHSAVVLETARLVETEEARIEELQALDEMKDDFLSILSHELRGPATAMTGYAHLLRDRWESLADDRRNDFLSQIIDGSRRLSRLVGDVLDATRAERSELSLARAELDLEVIAREVADQEVAASPPHRLEVRVSPPIPRVWADPDRVRQILHNLLSNAVKYSPDGGRITLDLWREEDAVALTVGDDGLGIPEEQLPQLFSKFHRVPTGRRIQGTGLGLYVTRLLVEAMDGSIEVSSTHGAGSRFTVRLPTVSATHVVDLDEEADAPAPAPGDTDTDA